jgi:hypothetical protein
MKGAGPFDVPTHVADQQLVLVDRTAECAAKFPDQLANFGFNPYPRGAVPLPTGQLEERKRESIVQAASRWALAQCYLPCAFEMSVCLLQDSSGNYGAYIAPMGVDEPGIYPATTIFFRPEAVQVAEEIRFHSPCVQYAGTINWERSSCKHSGDN